MNYYYFFFFFQIAMLQKGGSPHSCPDVSDVICGLVFPQTNHLMEYTREAVFKVQSGICLIQL